jgi:hypothetical protein
MLPCCPCTPPNGDKEGWKQYNKCCTIVVAVIMAIVGLIYLLMKL